MTSENISREDRMTKYSGKVFVVLKTDEDMIKLIEDEGDNILSKICKMFCGCFYDASSLWTFKRAPEPSDINW